MDDCRAGWELGVGPTFQMELLERGVGDVLKRHSDSMEESPSHIWRNGGKPGEPSLELPE